MDECEVVSYVRGVWRWSCFGVLWGSLTRVSSVADGGAGIGGFSSLSSSSTILSKACKWFCASLGRLAALTHPPILLRRQRYPLQIHVSRHGFVLSSPRFVLCAISAIVNLFEGTKGMSETRAGGEHRACVWRDTGTRITRAINRCNPTGANLIFLQKVTTEHVIFTYQLGPAFRPLLLTSTRSPRCCSPDESKR